MTNGEVVRRTAAVTGAGQGLGRSVALKLADKGYRVYGTGLADAEVDELRDASDGRVSLSVTDITDEQAVRTWAVRVGDDIGPAGLNVLISNAGILTPGPWSQTYFEQAYLARYLGFLLVEGGDLVARDGHVFVRTIAGLKLADVLWRTRAECGRRHGQLVTAVRTGCAGPVVDVLAEPLPDAMLRAVLDRGDGLRTGFERLGADPLQ